MDAIGTRDRRLCAPACGIVCRMINYTERIALLMQDIVRRTPSLSFIDLSEVLVFARFGRSDAEGAFATCHCLTLPESEPGYFFWRDRTTGELTRRSEWFVTKSPVVRLGDKSIKYLISFVLPRFCDQALERSRKARSLSRVRPAGLPSSIPSSTSSITSIRTSPGSAASCAPTAATRCDRTGRSSTSRSPRWSKAYLASNPDPAMYDFLKDDFAALTRGTAAWCRRRSGTFRRFRNATWSGWRCRRGLQRARRAAEAADAARAVHRRRSARPPVHRIEDEPAVPQGPGPGGLASLHRIRRAPT